MAQARYVVPGRVLTYVPLVEKSYRIHDNHDLHIALWGTCAEDTPPSVRVAWDPAKTKITGAKLRARVYSDTGAVWFDYYMNDNKVVAFTWEEWEGGQWRERTVDVLGLLINGDNWFKALTCKHYYYPWGVNVYVTGDLIVSFEGEQPKIEKRWEWWQYAVAAGVAIGGVVAVGYLITAVKR